MFSTAYARQRVAHSAHQARGLYAVARDIAHDEHDATVGRDERVVPVAADVDVDLRGAIGGRNAYAGDKRQLVGDDRPLQELDEALLVLELLLARLPELRAFERGRATSAEVDRELDIARRERAGAVVTDRQHGEPPSRDRDRHERARRVADAFQLGPELGVRVEPPVGVGGRAAVHEWLAGVDHAFDQRVVVAQRVHHLSDDWSERGITVRDNRSLEHAVGTDRDDRRPYADAGGGDVRDRLHDTRGVVEHGELLGAVEQHLQPTERSLLRFAGSRTLQRLCTGVDDRAHVPARVVVEMPGRVEPEREHRACVAERCDRHEHERGMCRIFGILRVPRAPVFRRLDEDRLARADHLDTGHRRVEADPAVSAHDPVGVSRLGAHHQLVGLHIDRCEVARARVERAHRLFDDDATDLVDCRHARERV